MSEFVPLASGSQGVESRNLPSAFFYMFEVCWRLGPSFLSAAAGDDDGSRGFPIISPNSNQTPNRFSPAGTEERDDPICGRPKKQISLP